MARQWPGYAAYALSFFTVGIVWISHQAQFARVERTDQGLLILNLFVLPTVAVLPFPTAVMARFLRAGDDEGLALALYAATVLAMGLAYFAIWEYAAHRGLLGTKLSARARATLRRRHLVGPACSGASVGLAFVTVNVALAVCAAGGLYYVVPGRWDL